MMLARRFFHQVLARLAGRWPVLADKLVASFRPQQYDTVPWTAMTRPLKQSKVAVVTTAGVHHRDQPKFDMRDPKGDPSFRVLNAATIEDDYVITHDYYDHRDADQDLNIVLPMKRLREMQAAGSIGALAQHHYGFMGHIDGRHVETLIRETAPQVAAKLRKEGVDAVLLTPA